MQIEIKDTGFGLDLEGPLVNLEREGHHQAYLDAAASVGVHLTFEEAVVAIPDLIGGREIDIATQVFQLSNKLIPAEKIMGRKKEIFEEWMRSIPFIPTRNGLFNFLEEAQKRGFKMVIATATEPHLALYYIEKSGLGEIFSLDQENIVTAGPTIKTKPEPDIYLESARRMGIESKNQLIFEDSVRGVTAGVASGGVVIGIPVYKLERAVAPLIKAGALEVYGEWAEVDIDYLLSDKFQSKRETPHITATE